LPSFCYKINSEKYFETKNAQANITASMIQCTKIVNCIAGAKSRGSPCE